MKPRVKRNLGIIIGYYLRQYPVPFEFLYHEYWSGSAKIDFLRASIRNYDYEKI